MIRLRVMMKALYLLFCSKLGCGLYSVNGARFGSASAALPSFLCPYRDSDHSWHYHPKDL